MPNAAASILCPHPFSETSVIQAARECLERLGTNPSLAWVFASADYRPHLRDFLELLQLHAHAPLLLGGSASGLIGSAEESEGASGFSLLLVSLPQTRLTPLSFSEQVADDFHPTQWRDLAGAGADSEAWIVLGNPLAMAAEPWLATWSKAFPGVPVLGGLASGGPRGDDVFLFHNRDTVEAGVALGLRGGVRLHSVISQGCRPIGEPHAITGADENVITSIGSLPAYERLQESFDSLSPEEKARAAGNLFAGLALNEYVDDFKTGDFLIRNLLGADAESGSIALAAYPRLGQTLQFQLRDRLSAHEELHSLLKNAAHEGIRPIASLLFACGGRGTSLFGSPHHDAAAIQHQFGQIPCAGLFCNGEIGPVAGKNFVHGYTAAIGLLE